MISRRILLTVDEDGGVTIPADIRREFGIKAGDLVRVVKSSPVPSPGTGSFLDHAGSLRPVTEYDSDEDMDRRIHEESEEAAVRRHNRSREE